MMTTQHIVRLLTAITPINGVSKLSATRHLNGEGRVLMRVPRALINAVDSFLDGIAPAATHGLACGTAPSPFLSWAGFRLNGDGIGISQINKTGTEFNNAEYGLENTANGCQSPRERQMRPQHRT